MSDPDDYEGPYNVSGKPIKHIALPKTKIVKVLNKADITGKL